MEAPEPVKLRTGYGDDTALQEPQTELAVLGSIDRSLRTIKSILSWWFALVIVGAAAWIAYRISL